MSELSKKLIKWHKKSGRKDLPWQVETDPYKVWISEVMLQQTQVQTVIPYYLRFIDRFPDIHSLSKSNENEVLSYWSGLGYYSRGRNLLKTAKILQDDFDSIMPQCSEKLESLPGIGKSTAGAILSLGFKLKAPILDGNAKRLLVRYFKVEEPIDSAKTMKNLWKIASENLPLKECDIYTQAIMDVGSLICKRKSPDCENCPLNKTCLSFKEGIQDLLPLKSPSKNKPSKQLYWLLLQNKEGEVLLENRTSKGVWKGLWTFLSFEKIELREEFIKRLPKGYEFIEQDLKLKHTFTHYKLDIDTTLVRLNEDFQNQDNNKVWFNNKELSEIGLPMPVTKILKDHIKDAQSFL